MITIPAIDLRGARVVRLKQGDPEHETVYSDDPVAVAREFRAAGARLLHLVDLDAALGTGDNRDVVAGVCAALNIPVQIGGGLRSMEAVESIFAAGASRAVLGTAATDDPVFLNEVVETYGERVVVALDVRERVVFTHGWTQEAGSIDLILAGLAAQGVPRFMLTQIEADGMMEGPDLGLYRHAASFTDAPLIASGGVSTADDLRALAETGVEGAIVGKALYEGTIDFAEVAEL